MWRKGNPLTLLVGAQTSTATMENSVEIFKNLEIELPYDPAIPLLGIHTEEIKIERDTPETEQPNGGRVSFFQICMKLANQMQPGSIGGK